MVDVQGFVDQAEAAAADLRSDVAEIVTRGLEALVALGSAAQTKLDETAEPEAEDETPAE